MKQLINIGMYEGINDEIKSLKNTSISTDERAVICLVGTFRTLDLTHDNLVEKVIKPLNADVIICVTRLTAEDEAYLDYFKDCNVVDVCIYEDSKYGYEDLCDQFSNKLNIGNQWREYFNIQGNWLGGMKGRKGSGIHLTYN